jgi:hypothetical protein
MRSQGSGGEEGSRVLTCTLPNRGGIARTQELVRRNNSPLSARTAVILPIGSSLQFFNGFAQFCRALFDQPVQVDFASRQNLPCFGYFGDIRASAKPLNNLASPIPNWQSSILKPAIVPS